MAKQLELVEKTGFDAKLTKARKELLNMLHGLGAFVHLPIL